LATQYTTGVNGIQNTPKSVANTYQLQTENQENFLKTGFG